jgi:putative transposase
MMAERGIDLDHSTVHRWVLYFNPKLLDRFNCRKHQVTRKWNLNETYIKVKGEWPYLYRAIYSNGDTVEFYLRKDPGLARSAKPILAFLCPAKQLLPARSRRHQSWL